MTKTRTQLTKDGAVQAKFAYAYINYCLATDCVVRMGDTSKVKSAQRRWARTFALTLSGRNASRNHVIRLERAIYMYVASVK